MNNCKLDLLKKSSLYNKNRIISVCLFILEKPYRDFSVYTNGLKKLVKERNAYRNDFSIRVYVDSEKAAKIVKPYDVDIYLYTCEKYQNSNKVHDGLFGTLVRYFPLFGHDVDTKNVIIYSDLDKFNLASETIDEFLKYEGFMSMRNRILVVPYGIWMKDQDSINAGKNMSINLILDQTILNTFIDKMWNSDDNLFKVRGFPYGVDEYFLIHFLSKHINIFRYEAYNISAFLAYMLKTQRWFIEKLNIITNLTFKDDDTYINTMRRWYFQNGPNISKIAKNYYWQMRKLWNEKVPDARYTKYLKYYYFRAIYVPKRKIITQILIKKGNN